MKVTTRLPLNRVEVFRFFTDPANLERITLPELCLRIITPQPFEIKQGTLIDYQFRLWGMPVRWQTLISHWNPPLEFVDEQLRGPYRKWIHAHRFREYGGQTVIDDDVHYQLPLWPFGEVTHPFVRRKLNRIFAYREETITRLLLKGR